MYLVALINCGLFLLLTVFGKNAYQLSEPAFDEEYLAYHEQEDDTKLFRYYFPTDVVRPFSNLNLNASILYDYRTTTTYDSTYDAAVRPFLDLIDIDSWIIDIDNPEILQMLGVKYVGVLDEASLPSEDMEYVFDLNNIKVYVFKKFNSIGHTYNNFVTDADGINWNEQLLVNSEDLNILQDITPTVKKQLKILEYNRQYFKGKIDVNAKTILYVAIPYSEGWNIVNQDGESLETINVQGGFLGVIIDENDRELSFYYGTPGLKNGLVITTVGLLALMGLFYFDKRKKI